jgi:hypothetical protein
MPVDTRHPEFMVWQDRWQRCRDVYGGEDAVKARRTTYLPTLEGQKETDASYSTYLQRAMFFPALERTVGGLIGTATRKPPVILAPTSVNDYIDDLTLVRDNFQAVLIRVLQELLLLGRVGIFVDWNEGLGRPYWTIYGAEQILNWQSERTPDSEIKLTHLVLEERVSAEGRDEFAHEQVTQYRELRLVDGQVLEMRLWRLGGERKEFVVVDTVVPRRGGTPLSSIPFVFIGPRGVTPPVQKPPLLDLVNLSLSHYRSSADLEHGRHFTALPTPWVTGWAGDTTGSALAIGSGTAWIIPNEQAKIGMLEFTGQGLGALERALESKERAMAVVGARLLEQQPRQAETAEAVRLRQAGEHSVLSTIIGSASAGLTLALQWMSWWTGVDAVGSKDIEIQLSKDFFEARLDAQEITALVGLWQASAISYETLYWNLQQGEWARPGITWEEEKDEIDEEDAFDATNAEPPLNAPPGSPVPDAEDEDDAGEVDDETPEGENALDEDE